MTLLASFVFLTEKERAPVYLIGACFLELMIATAGT